MEKPNFTRLANVFEKEYEKIVFEHEKDEDPIKLRIRKLERTWNRIIESQGSNDTVDKFYKYPEIIELKDLCEDYKIGYLYADLRFIGYEFNFKLETSLEFDHNRGDIPQKHTDEIELLSVLKAFKKYNNQISVNLIRKQKVIGSIQNKELINIIESSIFEYFKKNDLDVRLGIHPIENEDFWIGYLENRISLEKIELKKFTSFEKYKSSVVKHCVFILWVYLSNFTKLKPQEGLEYSNEQGRFIFRFLEIFDFINKDKQISKKEDVVGYYLRSYQKINPTRTIIRYKNI